MNSSFSTCRAPTWRPIQGGVQIDESARHAVRDRVIAEPNAVPGGQRVEVRAHAEQVGVVADQEQPSAAADESFDRGRLGVGIGSSGVLMISTSYCDSSSSS